MPRKKVKKLSKKSKSSGPALEAGPSAKAAEGGSKKTKSKRSTVAKVGEKKQFLFWKVFCFGHVQSDGNFQVERDLGFFV